MRCHVQGVSHLDLIKGVECIDNDVYGAEVNPGDKAYLKWITFE